MFKKTVLAILCTVMCQISFGERCPSVSDVKNNSLHGWKAYDSEEGTLLSAAREAKFKKMVEKFALAEWSKSKKQPSSMHCYYQDNNGSNLEAYLAKDNFIPKLGEKTFWYQVSGFMHCAAGMDKCEFGANPLTKRQLAKK